MKLIATDLDGTLLRNDRTLSHRTLNALRTATESGAEVVFVTARPPRFVEALPTGLVGTAICSNSQHILRLSGRAAQAQRKVYPMATEITTPLRNTASRASSSSFVGSPVRITTLSPVTNQA